MGEKFVRDSECAMTLGDNIFYGAGLIKHLQTIAKRKEGTTVLRRTVMLFIQTDIPDIYIIEPHVYSDYRGFFWESWSKCKFEAAGLFYTFVQENHSYSATKGTVRGIHFQRGNRAQAKLVRCISGALLDVAVDLRPGSSTFRKWTAVELSAKNKRQFLIPRGFGHGFVTLADDTQALYKADAPYDPSAEGGIRWNDPTLDICWGVTEPVLSEKDRQLPWLEEVVTDY